MMKSLILSLLLITASAFAGGIEGGNGGGGVVKNGVYKTFYSAGLYIEPTSAAEVPVRVPAIQRLLGYLASIDYLSLETKKPIMMAIQPTTKRQYLIAAPELLTPEIKARLLAEFQRVTGADPSQLELYAITDTRQKVTYLLPGFENLSADDQTAILFHEAYWILHPDATYDQVIHAEMAFEAAMKSPNNAAAVYDFVKYLGDRDEALSAKMKWELASGNLNGFLNANGQFTLGQLFGQEYIACVKQQQTTRKTSLDYPFKTFYDLDRSDTALTPSS